APHSQHDEGAAAADRLAARRPSARQGFRPFAVQAVQRLWANMMSRHAVNHGTNDNAVEPALEEIRAHMFGGKIAIAPHNAELIEALRYYHRDENFKMVKQRDDEVSALRYAVMMKRSGKALSDCDGVGFGKEFYAHQRRQNAGGSGPQTAKDVDFDLF